MASMKAMILEASTPCAAGVLRGRANAVGMKKSFGKPGPNPKYKLVNPTCAIKSLREELIFCRVYSLINAEKLTSRFWVLNRKSNGSF
jgi:hypothetical protein